ncbi:MAG: FecR domain-containing protein [Pseudomonadota bacterium]
MAVDLSEARIDRLWGRVSARLGERRRRPGWLRAAPVLGAVGLVAVVVVIVFEANGMRGGRDRVASPWQGAQLETAADALAVTLADGSLLKLDPRSRIEVRDRSASGVKLVLARGRIACDVTHRPGRSFVVVAGGVEVHVVGTRFSVAAEQGAGGARVEVQVERGAVEVQGSDASGVPVRVEAGHSWSQVTRTAALDGTPASPPRAEAPDAAGPPEPPDTAQALVARQQAAEQEPPARPARPARVAASRSRPDSDARELFEMARNQWRAGRIDQAARTYRQLLEAHPRDPRAGLAAFELGRLLMDHLGDRPGAVKALEQAVALAPDAELREDALARLVGASAATQDPDRCASARARYLAEYPSGVHRRTVSATSCH